MKTTGMICQVGRGGVDTASSSDALGSWFEPHSTSKNTTSLSEAIEAPQGADPPISELSEKGTLCNQSFLNKTASSADESSAKVLFKHPSTTFVSTKT